MKPFPSFLKTFLFSLLLGLTLSHNAKAVGYWGTYSSTLWNTPSEYFTDEDWAFFEGTLRKTLDTAKDSEVVAWANPKSKTSGDFTVLKTVMRGERKCREVKITAQARELRRVTGIAFCQLDDGTWEAIPGHNAKTR